VEERRDRQKCPPYPNPLAVPENAVTLSPTTVISPVMFPVTAATSIRNVLADADVANKLPASANTAKPTDLIFIPSPGIGFNIISGNTND
jgi:hypothetical protein